MEGLDVARRRQALINSGPGISLFAFREHMFEPLAGGQSQPEGYLSIGPCHWDSSLVLAPVALQLLEPHARYRAIRRAAKQRLIPSIKTPAVIVVSSASRIVTSANRFSRSILTTSTCGFTGLPLVLPVVHVSVWVPGPEVRDSWDEQPKIVLVADSSPQQAELVRTS
ncbi:hypothetical protein A0H81_07629 [Grifola frondosa]|uniref:Uncharacterized protein n=1 Tax=Grifola frondosa TaxID=5627 RepID=A0A1C7M7X6_GRIFR|nr:hypothetical protein A0H81_07629 [Grifola frondosa]